MNKILLAVLGLGALLVLLMGLAVAVSYVGAYNYGNQVERQLEAKWLDNQNILGQYTLKIGEMAQVPEMYRDDLKEVIRATFEGRYGADGSKATFQWIQEQNLQFDSSLYTRLQQTMEAGRNQFTNVQTEMLEVKRGYETELGSFWGGMWLKFAGYPKVDLAKYKVVLAAGTAEKFETGIDTGIKLRTKPGVEE